MPPSPLAVVDACVLVPAALGDFLMRAAAAGLYDIRWTDDILDEVRRTMVGDLGKSADQSGRRIAVMKRAFPEALITSHRQLVDAMPQAVHAKDRHVVAAAVASGASLIVTSNLRDFPAAALASLGIEAESPDDFLSDLYAQNADDVITILLEQAAALRRPPMTPLQVIDAIGRHAPAFAALLRPLFQTGSS